MKICFKLQIFSTWIEKTPYFAFNSFDCYIYLFNYYFNIKFIIF